MGLGRAAEREEREIEETGEETVKGGCLWVRIKKKDEIRGATRIALRR